MKRFAVEHTHAERQKAKNWEHKTDATVAALR